MRSSVLNSNSGSYGGGNAGVKVITDGIQEKLINADTVSGDKTFTFDSEAEVFVGSTIGGVGIVPGSVVDSINTGTAGTNVTSVELSIAAIPTATDIATTYVGVKHLTVEESGQKILVPDLDEDKYFVLPEAQEGLTYQLVYVGGAEEAKTWRINTRYATDSSYFVGGILALDINAGAAVEEYSNGSSNSMLDIVTPAAGTRVQFYCDGKVWYVDGFSASDTAQASQIAFADHA